MIGANHDIVENCYKSTYWRGYQAHDAKTSMNCFDEEVCFTSM
jgi:hypothetical protein